MDKFAVTVAYGSSGMDYSADHETEIEVFANNETHARQQAADIMRSLVDDCMHLSEFYQTTEVCVDG